jgi:hypothetical protein
LTMQHLHRICSASTINLPKMEEQRLENKKERALL